MTSNEPAPAAPPPSGVHSDRPASPVATADSRPAYGPGHPWHYLPQGDNQPPLAPEQIETGNTGDTIERDLPKDPTKREHRLRALLISETAELQADIERYRDIAARDAEALSDYDRNIAYGGNLDMARASSLALKHSHIAWRKGRIAYIKAELDRFGPLLF